MSQFKKILVPVDFSEQSVNALEYAYSLARKTKSEVIVLHVVDKRAHYTYLGRTAPPIEGWPSFWEEPPKLPLDLVMRESALDLSNFLARSAPKSWRVKVARRLRLGKPIKEIAATARKENVDLVVLGLRKRFLFSHFVSGQFLKLIERLPYPVLLAPPKESKGRDSSEPDYSSYPFREEWCSDSAVSWDHRV